MSSHVDPGAVAADLWTPTPLAGDNASCATDAEEPKLRWSALGLTVIIVATTAGNLLVCLAVCLERRLQNITNYFLMSLSIADLLVSLLVMPLGMVVELYGQHRSIELLPGSYDIVGGITSLRVVPWVVESLVVKLDINRNRISADKNTQNCSNSYSQKSFHSMKHF